MLSIIANYYKVFPMSPNYFSTQYTECHKMIIDDLYLDNGVELSSDTISRLNELNEEDCYSLWSEINATYLPELEDPDNFVIKYLNSIDYHRLKNEIEKMKSAIYKRDENIRLSTADIDYIFGLGKTRGAQCRQVYSKLMGFRGGKKYSIDYKSFLQFFDEHCQ